MDDQKIVNLYWERSADAISETQKKYGKYCHTIAYNILNSREDAEECVNDTYIRTWKAIPPHKPERLSTFLGKITRNLALDRYAYDTAKKRAGSVQLALNELGECIPAPATGRNAISDEIALKTAINGFLESLPSQTRKIFVRRYWYVSSIKEIARDFGFTESKVKVTLLRTRNDFKAYLEKEGIVL